MATDIRTGGRLWARWGLDPVRGLLDGVYVEWAEGLFVKAEEMTQPPRHLAPEECYGSHLLTPGLLNAHTHLDYSFMREPLPRGVGFAKWLRGLVAARRGLSPEGESERAAACRPAIEELKRDGVTEVWDISTFGWARQALAASGLRAISFEEWSAPRAEFWETAWDAWRARFGRECAPLAEASREWLAPGISAHSTYTLCPEALAAAGAYARRERLPQAIHLAESPEEIAMLTRGEGALLEALRELTGADPLEAIGVGPTPFKRAEAAGLLGPQTLAIHANLPEPEDIRLVRAAGAVVVFCPRSHAFFGYPPYPLQAWKQAGVRMALGSDGITSNDSLEMREEIRAFMGVAAGWRPLEILGVATGAALGEGPPFGGRGRIETGRGAQWALWRLEGMSGAAVNGINEETMLEMMLAKGTRLERSSAIT